MHLFPITIQKGMKITMTTKTNVKTKLQQIRKFKELWYERAMSEINEAVYKSPERPRFHRKGPW